jgi:hypothetical protein
LVAVVALSWPAAPASAAPVTITGGVLDVYDTSSPLDSISISGAPCTSPPSDLTFTGSASSGTLAMQLEADEAITFFGTNYRAEIVVMASGSYLSGGLSMSAWATIDLTRTTGLGSCTGISGVGPCRIVAGNITLNGSYTATAAALGGTNHPFDNAVLQGNPGDCGPLLSANDGWLDVVGVTLAL